MKLLLYKETMTEVMTDRPTERPTDQPTDGFTYNNPFKKFKLKFSSSFPFLVWILGVIYLSYGLT